MVKISVTASSFPLSKEEILKTIQFWKKEGISLNPVKGVGRKKDLLCASSLESRSIELKKAFSSKEESLFVWALRGGYGMQELLPVLEKKNFSSKKIFIGFSDCTSLHYYLNQSLRQPSVHGPHPNSFHKDLNSDKILNDYKRLLKSPNEFSPQFKGLKKLNETTLKEVQGKIVGGNLTTLISLIGTKWAKSLRGKILFLEEVSEPAYKVNRMLTHLDQSGFLKGVSAVVFGHMSHSLKKEEALIKKVAKRWAQDKKAPVLWGMQAGHRHSKNNPFWLGKRSRLLLDSNPSLLNNV